MHGIAHPIAQAAYWTNQHILDGIVNGVGRAGRTTGDWVYRNIDQRVVDGAVNASGTGRLRKRSRPPTGPVRQGQPVRRAVVRRRHGRRHRAHPPQRLRDHHGFQQQLPAHPRHLPADGRRARDDVHPGAPRRSSTSRSRSSPPAPRSRSASGRWRCSTTTGPRCCSSPSTRSGSRSSSSNYTIGLDGISLPLYILSMAVTFLVVDLHLGQHARRPATRRRS